MFFGERKIFNKVCEILFEIIFELHEELKDILPDLHSYRTKRVIAYLSERILSVMFDNHKYFLGINNIEELFVKTVK